ncbi:MAG: leucine-rich repeat protein [Lachnospiraceae bacterium]|jgi:hypothetical protein|nr:leucine-rich repeat protein [Lachnospiraceae bacterium]
MELGAYTVFTYSLNRNGQAMITKYQGNASNVLIPETLNGYPVIGIGEKAFQNNKKIQNVSIPACVEHIGRLAFHKCAALEYVALPNNSRHISIRTNTFDGCTNLKNTSGTERDA